MSDATVGRGATRPAPPIGWRRRALDALDERLGLKGLQYPIPAHANTLAYSLGGLTLITFVLLVATGVFLTQYYNPDPAVAHGSVRHIITGVTGGEFIRSFHYWGAMAMIVLVGLHLLRGFASASFKRPREGNWVIGVVLAGITAGLFFTGSVLKWDQESLEALEHNIEVGKLLGRFGFWFSDTFGGIALLTRLYVVHISILPTLFTLAVVAHLLLVKRHGMTPSPFRRQVAKDTGPQPTRPFVHPPPCRVGHPGAAAGGRDHAAGGAAATAARAGADRGHRGHQAALAAAVDLPGRGLGRRVGDPVGHPGHLCGTAAGPAGRPLPGAASAQPSPAAGHDHRGGGGAVHHRAIVYAATQPVVSHIEM
jgi:hypothetical protein